LTSLHASEFIRKNREKLDLPVDYHPYFHASSRRCSTSFLYVVTMTNLLSSGPGSQDLMLALALVCIPNLRMSHESNLGPIGRVYLTFAYTLTGDGAHV
jgi:hypothetical protein